MMVMMMGAGGGVVWHSVMCPVACAAPAVVSLALDGKLPESIE